MDEYTTTPAIGDVILVKNDHKLGDGPEWMPAIVVDGHTLFGGSISHEDGTVFSVAAFAPQAYQPRPWVLYFGSGEHEEWKWRQTFTVTGEE